MATKSEKLKDALDKLVGATKDIHGAFLAQKNGMLIATNEQYDQKKAEKEAAQAAVMFASSKKFLDGIENGKLQKVLINGSAGDMVALPVNDGIFLAITACKDPMLGMIFVEAEATSKFIYDKNLLD